MQHKGRPELFRAFVFFCTALSIAAFRLAETNIQGYDGSLLYPPASVAVALLLIGAALALRRSRLGNAIALGGGLAALVWFVQSEWGTLAYLNSSGDLPTSELLLTALRVVSAALIALSIACGCFRLLPDSWLYRSTPVSQRTWPPTAVAAVAMAAWFVHSAVPYRVPGFHNEVSAPLVLVHVEKRGLQFSVVRITVLRDARIYVSTANRKLFQYSFPVRTYVTSSATAYEHAKALADLPELWGRPASTSGPLRSWNADAWYVAKPSQLRAFTTANGLAPPPLVTNTFRELQTIPPVAELKPTYERDFCLGFCYDDTPTVSPN